MELFIFNFILFKELWRSQEICSETSKTGQNLQGYMLQFDCQSTTRTWIGRQKYKHHSSHMKDSIEKEIFITQKMSELQKTGLSRKASKNDVSVSMDECAFPFNVKVIVKPVNAKLNSQTDLTFDVTPGGAFAKSDFNNFMNCFVNIAKNALTSFI